ALEERARRPELLFVVRCGLEQALAPRRPLLAPEDLAAPWSASRALLEGARAGDAQQRTLAWLVEDGAWSEVLLAVGRAAAFRAGRDGLDGELRDLLEEELADEAAWGDDPERRRAAWRVVAAAARDGRGLARDPAERSALAGLLADALLYEAGCLEPGAERQRLLTRARALAAESAPEQVRGGRRPLEATWRQARVLGALDDPGFAGAFQALAAAVMRADAGELGRLGRRARRDPLLPLLVERPGYGALAERLGRR
ncbi:MAG: hypothetical protein KF878_16600, partial [Planctomycetes bacterium]|nr:hypothetical protein [Planctomycetota bacterium]